MVRILIILSIVSACRKQNVATHLSGPRNINAIYEGIWWAEGIADSLVIKPKGVKMDSVYYITNMCEFDSQITHKVGFEPKDDNLILKRYGQEYSFRREH